MYYIFYKKKNWKIFVGFLGAKLVARVEDRAEEVREMA